MKPCWPPAADRWYWKDAATVSARVSSRPNVAPAISIDPPTSAAESKLTRSSWMSSETVVRREALYEKPPRAVLAWPRTLGSRRPDVVSAASSEA